MPRNARLGWALPYLLSVSTMLSCVDSATEHRVRANAYLRGGDAQGALQEIDAGLALAKDNVSLLLLRGKALFELSRFDEAKAAYRLAIANGKDEEARSLSEGFLGLGMIGSRTKDWALARENFTKLVEINDKDASSQLNLARVCVELSDMKCAVERAEIAGRLSGNEEGVLYTLGNIYLAAARLNEAELTFKHLCEVVPGAASCPYGLALSAAKAGNTERALEQLREAIRRKLPNGKQVSGEPAFASLRDNPEFLKLVAEAASAAP